MDRITRSHFRNLVTLPLRSCGQVHYHLNQISSESSEHPIISSPSCYQYQHHLCQTMRGGKINLKFKISRGNKSTPKPARSPKQCHWHRKNIQPLAILRNYIQKQEKRDALHFKITFSLVQHYNTGMEKPLVLQIIDSSEFKLKTGIFYWTKSEE